MRRYKLIITNTIKRQNMYILLILINISIIMLGSLLISNYQKTKEINDYINSYLNIEDLYEVSNSWSFEDNEEVLKLDEQIGGESYSYISKYEKNIREKGASIYGIDQILGYYTYNFDITEVKDKEEFKSILTFIKDVDEYNKEIPHNAEIFLSKVAGLQIKYPVIEGRNLNEEDYSDENNEYLNVLAGYDFKKEFKLGDILTIELPGKLIEGEEPKNEEQKLKIVGFIDKDTEVLETLAGSRLMSIDNKLIIPLKDNPTNEFLYLIKNDIFSLGSGLITTKDPELVEEKLLEEARADGYEGKESFVKITPATFSYALNRESGNEESFNTYLRVLVGIILLAIVVTILSIWLMVRKNRRSYGILMLSGGTRKDIAIGISIGTMAVAIFSYLIGAISYYLLFKEIISILVVLVHFIVMGIIVILTSIIILNKKKISYFIAFDENSN